VLYSRDACFYGSPVNKPYLPGLDAALVAAGATPDAGGAVRCADPVIYRVEAEKRPRLTAWTCCEQHVGPTVTRVRIETEFVRRNYDRELAEFTADEAGTGVDDDAS
jgi:hypothetical protein